MSEFLPIPPEITSLSEDQTLMVNDLKDWLQVWRSNGSRHDDLGGFNSRIAGLTDLGSSVNMADKEIERASAEAINANVPLELVNQLKISAGYPVS